MLETLQGIETKPSETPAVRPQVKPPQDAPYLHLAEVSMGEHTIAFWDHRLHRSLPKGVTRLELFCVLHDERGDAPLEKARYWRSFVQSPVKIGFEESADKKTATYYARWANENGDVGPWSSPVSKSVVV